MCTTYARCDDKGVRLLLQLTVIHPICRTGRAVIAGAFVFSLVFGACFYSGYGAAARKTTVAAAGVGFLVAGAQ